MISEDRSVTVSVEGAGSLAGFGSADPFNEEAYTGNVHRTYYGRVQAVIRAGYRSGEIAVSAAADGCATCIRRILVQ